MRDDRKARRHEIMARQCDQCLLSKRAIVSAARRRQLLTDCRRKDIDFLCHKATIEGRDVVCRGHFNSTGGGQMTRIMGRLGLIRWIDPDTLAEAEKAQ